MSNFLIQTIHIIIFLLGFYAADGLLVGFYQYRWTREWWARLVVGVILGQIFVAAFDIILQILF